MQFIIMHLKKLHLICIAMHDLKKNSRKYFLSLFLVYIEKEKPGPFYKTISAIIPDLTCKNNMD